MALAYCCPIVISTASQSLWIKGSVQNGSSHEATFFLQNIWLQLEF